VLEWRTDRCEQELMAGYPFDDEHGFGAERAPELSTRSRLLWRSSDAKQEAHRSSDVDRLRLAKSPKCRMRTSPLGRTWMRNRRTNSSAETVMTFCLLPCV
jgi:hypothetical protein